MTDLVPQAIRDLLTFYKERYPEARFGDVDVGVLQSAVDSIDEAAQAVVRAEEALAATRASFRDVEVEISQKAARALSFLKIFVDGDEEPLAKLEAIAASMPATRRKPKVSVGDPEIGSVEPRPRRGRKPKGSDESAAALLQESSSVELASSPVADSDISSPSGASEVDFAEPVAVAKKPVEVAKYN
jgi:hypothetical protein